MAGAAVAASGDASAAISGATNQMPTPAVLDQIARSIPGTSASRSYQFDVASDTPYPIWLFNPEGGAYRFVYSVAKYAGEALETFHTFTGLPWWATIIAVGALTRVASFPLNWYSLRNSSRAVDARQDLSLIRMAYARAKEAAGSRPDAVGAQARMLRQAVLGIKAALEKADCRPLRSLAIPFLQLPVMVASVLGARHAILMGDESFESGGLAWFADLTVPDPYYIMPVAALAASYASMELVFRGRPGASTSGGAGLLGAQWGNLFKSGVQMSLLLLAPFVVELPSGLFLLMTFNGLYTMAYVTAVRHGPIYKALTGRDVPSLAAGALSSSAGVDLQAPALALQRLAAQHGVGHPWQHDPAAALTAAAAAGAPRADGAGGRGGDGGALSGAARGGSGVGVGRPQNTHGLMLGSFFPFGGGGGGGGGGGHGSSGGGAPPSSGSGGDGGSGSGGGSAAAAAAQPAALSAHASDAASATVASGGLALAEGLSASHILEARAGEGTDAGAEVDATVPLSAFRREAHGHSSAGGESLTLEQRPLQPLAFAPPSVSHPGGAYASAHGHGQHGGSHHGPAAVIGSSSVLGGHGSAHSHLVGLGGGSGASGGGVLHAIAGTSSLGMHTQARAAAGGPSPQAARMRSLSAAVHQQQQQQQQQAVSDVEGGRVLPQELSTRDAAAAAAAAGEGLAPAATPAIPSDSMFAVPSAMLASAAGAARRFMRRPAPLSAPSSPMHAGIAATLSLSSSSSTGPGAGAAAGGAPASPARAPSSPAAAAFAAAAMASPTFSHIAAAAGDAAGVVGYPSASSSPAAAAGGHPASSASAGGVVAPAPQTPVRRPAVRGSPLGRHSQQQHPPHQPSPLAAGPVPAAQEVGAAAAVAPAAHALEGEAAFLRGIPSLLTYESLAAEEGAAPVSAHPSQGGGLTHIGAAGVAQAAGASSAAPAAAAAHVGGSGAEQQPPFAVYSSMPRRRALAPTAAGAVGAAAGAAGAVQAGAGGDAGAAAAQAEEAAEMGRLLRSMDASWPLLTGHPNPFILRIAAGSPRAPWHAGVTEAQAKLRAAHAGDAAAQGAHPQPLATATAAPPPAPTSAPAVPPPAAAISAADSPAATAAAGPARGLVAQVLSAVQSAMRSMGSAAPAPSAAPTGSDIAAATHAAPVAAEPLLQPRRSTVQLPPEMELVLRPYGDAPSGPEALPRGQEVLSLRPATAADAAPAVDAAGAAAAAPAPLSAQQAFDQAQAEGFEHLRTLTRKRWVLGNAVHSIAGVPHGRPAEGTSTAAAGAAAAGGKVAAAAGVTGKAGAAPSQPAGDPEALRFTARTDFPRFTRVHVPSIGSPVYALPPKLPPRGTDIRSPHGGLEALPELGPLTARSLEDAWHEARAEDWSAVQAALALPPAAAAGSGRSVVGAPGPAASAAAAVATPGDLAFGPGAAASAAGVGLSGAVFFDSILAAGSAVDALLLAGGAGAAAAPRTGAAPARASAAAVPAGEAGGVSMGNSPGDAASSGGAFPVGGSGGSAGGGGDGHNGGGNGGDDGNGRWVGGPSAAGGKAPAKTAARGSKKGSPTAAGAAAAEATQPASGTAAAAGVPAAAETDGSDADVVAVAVAPQPSAAASAAPAAGRRGSRASSVAPGESASDGDATVGGYASGSGTAASTSGPSSASSGDEAGAAAAQGAAAASQAPQQAASASSVARRRRSVRDASAAAAPRSAAVAAAAVPAAASAPQVARALSDQEELLRLLLQAEADVAPVAAAPAQADQAAAGAAPLGRSKHLKLPAPGKVNADAEAALKASLDLAASATSVADAAPAERAQLLRRSRAAAAAAAGGSVAPNVLVVNRGSADAEAAPGASDEAAAAAASAAGDSAGGYEDPDLEAIRRAMAAPRFMSGEGVAGADEETDAQAVLRAVAAIDNAIRHTQSPRWRRLRRTGERLQAREVKERERLLQGQAGASSAADAAAASPSAAAAASSGRAASAAPAPAPAAPGGETMTEYVQRMHDVRPLPRASGRHVRMWRRLMSPPKAAHAEGAAGGAGRRARSSPAAEGAASAAAPPAPAAASETAATAGDAAAGASSVSRPAATSAADSRATSAAAARPSGSPTALAAAPLTTRDVLGFDLKRELAKIAFAPRAPAAGAAGGKAESGGKAAGGKAPAAAAAEGSAGELRGLSDETARLLLGEHYDAWAADKAKAGASAAAGGTAAPAADAASRAAARGDAGAADVDGDGGRDVEGEDGMVAAVTTASVSDGAPGSPGGTLVVATIHSPARRSAAASAGAVSQEGGAAGRADGRQASDDAHGASAGSRIAQRRLVLDQDGTVVEMNPQGEEGPLEGSTSASSASSSGASVSSGTAGSLVMGRRPIPAPVGSHIRLGHGLGRGEGTIVEAESQEVQHRPAAGASTVQPQGPRPAASGFALAGDDVVEVELEAPPAAAAAAPASARRTPDIEGPPASVARGSAAPATSHAAAEGSSRLGSTLGAIASASLSRAVPREASAPAAAEAAEAPAATSDADASGGAAPDAAPEAAAAEASADAADAQQAQQQQLDELLAALQARVQQILAAEGVQVEVLEAAAASASAPADAATGAPAEAAADASAAPAAGAVFRHISEDAQADESEVKAAVSALPADAAQRMAARLQAAVASELGHEQAAAAAAAAGAEPSDAVARAANSAAAGSISAGSFEGLSAEQIIARMPEALRRRMAIVQALALLESPEYRRALSARYGDGRQHLTEAVAESLTVLLAAEFAAGPIAVPALTSGAAAAAADDANGAEGAGSSPAALLQASLGLPPSGQEPFFDLGNGRLVGHGATQAITRYHPSAAAVLEAEAAAAAAAQAQVDVEEAARAASRAKAEAAEKQRREAAGAGAGAGGAGGSSSGQLESARMAALRRLARLYADPRGQAEKDKEAELAQQAKAGPSARVRRDPRLQSTLQWGRAAEAVRTGSFASLYRSGLFPAHQPFPLDMLEAPERDRSADAEELLTRIAHSLRDAVPLSAAATAAAATTTAQAPPAAAGSQSHDPAVVERAHAAVEQLRRKRAEREAERRAKAGVLSGDASGTLPVPVFDAAEADGGDAAAAGGSAGAVDAQAAAGVESQQGAGGSDEPTGSGAAQAKPLRVRDMRTHKATPTFNPDREDGDGEGEGGAGSAPAGSTQ